MSGKDHPLFRAWRPRKTQQERDMELAAGKSQHELHVNWHKEHDFIPQHDNPAHRLFARPHRVELPWHAQLRPFGGHVRGRDENN